jgi:transposase
VTDALLTIDEGRRRRRRPVAKDPTPRFRQARVLQLDALLGCLEEQVPQAHLSRSVWKIVEQLDTDALEREYSPLGRHGYHPKRLLALWVYGSLIGIHHASKLARACTTDAALKWLCGGDSPSAPTLKRMRAKQGDFFAAALAEVILLGHAAGLVDLEAVAVDSLRVRAHAASSAVRTKSRSMERLAELAKIDLSKLDDAARARHEAKLKKHQEAVAACEARGVTSIVTTNDSAALMKFPSGASAPGHRATVVASGVSARFVLGVLVDAAPNDYGRLGAALEQARDVLDHLGLRNGRRMVAAADAGYWSDRDLRFASEASGWADVLVNEPPPGGQVSGLLGRDHFTLRPDSTVICPAGTQMRGPYTDGHGSRSLRWKGVGCSACSLKPQCTRGKRRNLFIDVEYERVRDAMRTRMARPGARERYSERIATVEPVFSFLEDSMGFRRSSSRHASTITSEILLKLLAYNIDRLIRAEREARRLSCVLFMAN